MLRPAVLASLLPIFLGATSAFGMEYSEAPMLAERVAAGELPPVEERLPEDPEVITPYESIGRYGGEIRFGILGTSDQELADLLGGRPGAGPLRPGYRLHHRPAEPRQQLGRQRGWSHLHLPPPQRGQVVGRHAADRRRRPLQHGGVRPEPRMGADAGLLHVRRQAGDSAQDRRAYRRVQLRRALRPVPPRTGEPEGAGSPLLPEGLLRPVPPRSCHRSRGGAGRRRGGATGGC